MKDLNGKIAFITGGASGIGLAMAEAFGREGMSVMLGDIDETAMNDAVAELRSKQIRAEATYCDVTDRNSVRSAALDTIAKFGKVHLVCNNAGVGSGGEFGDVSDRDWEWTIDVNFKGVVYGAEVFAPLLESHGEGGHIVNTASMAGMVAPPGMEPYNATKFAVVALSEGWQVQLAPRGIGVSVLCPGFVKSKIYDSQRNRPSKYGERTDDNSVANAAKQFVEAGMDPKFLAARVVEAIKANELYIFTHAGMKGAVEARFAGIMEAFDRSANSRALEGADEQPVEEIWSGDPLFAAEKGAN